MIPWWACVAKLVTPDGRVRYYVFSHLWLREVLGLGTGPVSAIRGPRPGGVAVLCLLPCSNKIPKISVKVGYER